MTTTTAPPLKPPHYASEENFRRFEAVLQQVVIKYPESVGYIAAPLSPSTATARLRDAINSVLLNKWSTTIDLERLAFIKPNIKVLQTEHGFAVVQKTRVSLAPIAVDSDIPQLLNLDEDCLNAFSLLLHHRLIKPIITNITPEVAFNLTTRYDLTFEQLPNNLIKLY